MKASLSQKPRHDRQEISGRSLCGQKIPAQAELERGTLLGNLAVWSGYPPTCCPTLKNIAHVEQPSLGRKVSAPIFLIPSALERHTIIALRLPDPLLPVVVLVVEQAVAAHHEDLDPVDAGLIDGAG